MDNLFAVVPTPGGGGMNPQSLIVGGDLLFVTHNHGGGTAQGSSNMMMQQLAAMQQSMIQNQMLIEEQRNKQIRMLEYTVAKMKLRELEEYKLGINGLIEDGENKQPLNKNDEEAIDAAFEIVKEQEKINNAPSENKEDEDMGNIEIDELEKYEDMQKSLSKQIKSDSIGPYVVELKTSSSHGDMYMPIVFTVRNDYWRSRVRYAVENLQKIKKELTVNKNGKTMPRHITVVLYNGERQAVEIIVVAPIAIGDYIGEYTHFMEVIRKEYMTEDKSMFIYEPCIKSICKSFGIELRRFYLLIEPILDGKAPPVLIGEGEDKYVSDHIKISPVLSFNVGAQRISLDTYRRGRIKINI
jgi:hypothetical protein